MQYLMLTALAAWLALASVPTRVANVLAVDSLALSFDTLALASGDQAPVSATCFNPYGWRVLCLGGVTWKVVDTAKVQRITTKAETATILAKRVGSSSVIATSSGGVAADTGKVVVTTNPPPPIPPTPAESAFVAFAHDTVRFDSGTTTRDTLRTYTSAAHSVLSIGKAVGASSTVPTVATVAPSSGGSPLVLTLAGLRSGTTKIIGSSALAGPTDTLVAIVQAVAPPPPPPGCTGIAVAPGAGQVIQNAVNVSAAGATFCLAGTYHQQTVVPKSRQTFRGAPGTVLDGDSVATYAFMRSGTDPDSVKLVGFRITRYRTTSQMGALLAGGHSRTEGTYGWIVDSLEVDHNGNLGIRVGHRMQVLRSNIHHNGTLGIGGVGDTILVDGLTDAYNNPSGLGLGDESGGSKFVRTKGLVVRNSYFHHNQGPCIWLDIGNDASLIENNVVEDCLQEGIVEEISYSSIIRNNTLRRNGLGDTRRTAWPWGAGIGIHSSGGTGIDIYGNVLEGNAHGIAIIQQPRGAANGDPTPREGDPSFTPAYLAQNVTVHNNTVTATPGQSLTVACVVNDAGGSVTFTSRGNTFTSNTYSLGGIAKPFCWMNDYRTSSEWTGTYGNH